MSWGVVAGAAITVVGGAVNNRNANKTAKKGAEASTAADQAAIDEDRRQFDKIQALFKPYVSGGQAAFTDIQELLGMKGEAKQGVAIEDIAQSPEMLAMQQQGENALLANASATGGLRGGNLQAALAQFRPQLLANQIQTQFGRLSSVAQIGQASAARQAAAGQQSAMNIGGYLGNIGSAQSGLALAQGQNRADMINTGVGALGQIIGAKF